MGEGDIPGGDIATVGSRVRTTRAGHGEPAGATGTVVGIGVFTPGILVVHLAGWPIDETVPIPRKDAVVIHEA